MIRKVTAVILLTAILIVLTGCWSNRDLSELAIATGFGIDKGDDGRMAVSIQIIKPSATKVSGKSGGQEGEKKSFVVVSSTGDTISGAITAMLSRANKRVFYSSAQVIVIGESVAREGIEDLLDFLLRDHETQYKTDMVIAKGISAREVLEQEYELSNIPGAFIADTLKNNENRAFTKRIMLIEAVKEIVSDDRQLSIGTIMKSGKTTETEGMAVFFRDRMVGWLDKFDTRGYLFVTGNVKSTILEVENPVVAGKKVAIELLGCSSKIDLKWGTDGKPAFTVKIKVQGNIGEQHDGQGIEENDFLKLLTANCSEKIKSEALSSIKECKERYKSDIFGFANVLYDKNPGYWRQVKENWNSEVFPDIRINVAVDTKLLRSGLIDKSIESSRGS